MDCQRRVLSRGPTWHRGPISPCHPCPHPAKFRVQRRSLHTGEPDGVPWNGEYVCGTHVRPAMMDNGDSVYKPWIVTRLEVAP